MWTNVVSTHQCQYVAVEPNNAAYVNVDLVTALKASKLVRMWGYLADICDEPLCGRNSGCGTVYEG